MLALAPAMLTLSLGEALAGASREPAAVVARAEAEVARRRVGVVSAPAAPVVTLGRTRYSAREQLQVSEEVRWLGERRLSVLSARALARSAEAAAGRADVEARHRVRLAWFDLAAAEDGERLATETESRAREFRDSVSARVEGGRAPRLDLVRAGAELARVAAASRASGEEKRGVWARLAALLGLDVLADGATDGGRPVLMKDGEAIPLRDPARAEAHPAVRAAFADVESARAALGAARTRRLPGLALSAGVNADDPGLPGPDWFGAVGLTLPLGARAAPAIRVAEAELAASEARLEAARREASQELEVAYRALRAASARLLAFDEEALPAADEAARLTREAYGYGRGDVFRVLETERALLEAKSARLAAYHDAKRAEADLLAAAGADQ